MPYKIEIDDKEFEVKNPFRAYQEHKPKKLKKRLEENERVLKIMNELREMDPKKREAAFNENVQKHKAEFEKKHPLYKSLYRAYLHCDAFVYETYEKIASKIYYFFTGKERKKW